MKMIKSKEVVRIDSGQLNICLVSVSSKQYLMTEKVKLGWSS